MEDDEEFEGEILEYFEDEYQEYWRNEIKRSDWDDGQKLGKILDENKLKQLYGDSTKLYMLADGESLLGYCVLSERSDIKSDDSPWISYVYTSASNRRKGYARMIIDYACEQAKNDGAEKIFASAESDDFINKVEFYYVKEEKNTQGQSKKIFSRQL